MIGTKSDPDYLTMANIWEKFSANDLLARFELMKGRRPAATFAFVGNDLILLPASAAMPWPAEEAFPDKIDGESVGPRGHAFCSGWVNAAGLPVFVAPAPVSAGGLPIGFQLVGDLGSEAVLIRIARDFERAETRANWRPPVALGTNSSNDMRPWSGAEA